MATSFKLADIFTAAEKQYGAYEIDLPEGGKVVLEPVLRIGQTRRDALTELSKPIPVLDAKGEPTFDDEGFPVTEDRDTTAYIQDALRIIAQEGSPVEALIEQIGDRLDVLKFVMDAWSEKSQPGEAKPSAS